LMDDISLSRNELKPLVKLGSSKSKK